ncbi:efflux RND transporter periplasmic adaptor subunit [Halomonas sp. HP20-15]|uniref:efflux RND transporter periplasmic adaptor subunit n=1 Tax=Halomonas sp. HP20-15 TaxID=3085901 RepID=UPI002980A445|nr:efflux RND transporter periplasmic adaptor subunit [Halomonas sp. HP20-15]MDW5377403.1 efflux RND transporter periplasmic adaptor subunit [Halomonas sp. HP20-15]
MRSRFSLSPAWLALLLGVALLVWLAFGDMQRFRQHPPAERAAAQPSLPRIEVETSQAQMHTPHVILQGHLESRQDVTLRARRAGEVTALPQPRGANVDAGERLIEIDPGDLPARIERAEAQLALSRSELSGAQKLSGRNLVSDNELLRLKSELAQSRAELAGLRESLADTHLEAPFAGVLDRLEVDLGDYLQAGEEIGLLVDIAQLKARSWLPQRRADEVREGMPVTVTLLDGRTLEGQVSFLARSAEDATRSYPLEVSVANPQRLRIAGGSATLDVALAERPAHRISPALLVLDERGRMGVKTVSDDARVRFMPVDIISADAEQAWVGGLPDEVRLVTLGGGFVEAGQRVEAVAAEQSTAQPASADSGNR